MKGKIRQKDFSDSRILNSLSLKTLTPEKTGKCKINVGEILIYCWYSPILPLLTLFSLSFFGGGRGFTSNFQKMQSLLSHIFCLSPIPYHLSLKGRWKFIIRQPDLPMPEYACVLVEEDNLLFYSPLGLAESPNLVEDWWVRAVCVEVGLTLTRMALDRLPVSRASACPHCPNTFQPAGIRIVLKNHPT